ncbi:cell morphogenesis protein [Histoplasma capsulatum G186AR]|uniref:Cell morphogenesis protein n=1 Tax=Ajellomyces capsulatus TaxID=5037 RepID=A0A8H8CXD5_AJECA|nr:cell morphogenesis protein [Histoplasma capsulatum]QSS75529.1 cell morphogenesis protein [Histoplasma capsulatum G186AR]
MENEILRNTLRDILGPEPLSLATCSRRPSQLSRIITRLKSPVSQLLSVRQLQVGNHDETILIIHHILPSIHKRRGLLENMPFTICSTRSLVKRMRK